MNFISAEEFLKQSEKVQNKLIEWWEPQIGDILVNKNNNINSTIEVINDEIIAGKVYEVKNKPFIPLLQTHQLIQFIEDEINKKIEIHHYSGGYEILDNDDLGNDLLQALWQVTIQIAEESV